MGDVRDRSPDRRDRRDSRGPRGSSSFGGRGKSGGGGGNSSNTRRAPPERRIFVSNIPFEMKWQEVKDLFRDNVGDVSYVELFSDENDKPRGCGILEFATEDLAKKAVEKMHRHEYKQRKLVVKEDFDTERDKYGRIINSKSARRDGAGDRDRDRDRERGRDSLGAGQGQQGYGNTYGLSPQFLESLGIDGPLHTRIFVANLSYTADERKLREVFRLAGRVVMVELNRDKDGKSRGHAVIEYDHPVEAVQAISMFNDQNLFDRKMTVRFDKAPGPTPEELAQLPSRLPEGLGGVGMGLGSGGNPLTEVAKNLPGSSNSANPQNNMSSAPAQSSGSGGLNVMEIAKTLAVARQLDMMGGGNSLGNLAGALSNLSGGNGSMGGNMGGAPPMGNSMMGSSSGSMGGPMGGNSMGGSSMSGPGPNMSAGPMGNSMTSSMGGPMTPMAEMGRGPPMSDMGSRGPPMSDMGSRGPPMSDMGSRGPPGGPSGYSTTSAGPTDRFSGGNNAYGSSMNRGGMSDSTQMSSARPFDTIIIRNLPLDCNWQVLREGFSHCGDIKYAEMKERGCGLIRFANERDAEKAISMMHKQTVAGRVIDVRPY